jgi:hypothetical protein
MKTYPDIFNRTVIQRKFNQYLQELNMRKSDIKDNEFGNKEKIFTRIVIDYDTFYIDLDLMISLFGIIWIIDEDAFDPNNQTKVEELCYKALNIQWTIRTKPEMGIDAITQVLKYYKELKKQIIINLK